MKPCKSCGRPFCALAFRPEKRRPGKYQTNCRRCESERGAKWARDNRVRASANTRALRAKDPENARKVRRAHYDRNKETVLAQAAEYRRNHKKQEQAARKAHYERNKERVAEIGRAYRQANKPKVAAWQKKYQSKKRGAIPSWANLDKIEEMYATSAWLTFESGEKWHVDHIIPLQGKTVCGLHCETNLTLLPASENLSKSNRYWPDMWDFE